MAWLASHVPGSKLGRPSQAGLGETRWQEAFGNPNWSEGWSRVCGSDILSVPAREGGCRGGGAREGSAREWGCRGGGRPGGGPWGGGGPGGHWGGAPGRGRTGEGGPRGGGGPGGWASGKGGLRGGARRGGAHRELGGQTAPPLAGASLLHCWVRSALTPWAQGLSSPDAGVQEAAGGPGAWCRGAGGHA